MSSVTNNQETKQASTSTAGSVDTDVRSSLNPPDTPQTIPKMSRWSGALVLVLFAAAFALGHHFDWKVPKFSELIGKQQTIPDNWCKEHNVPESICVNCAPKLLPKESDFGWCAKHGVHNCLLEHPESAQLKKMPTVNVVDTAAARADQALTAGVRKANNSRCKNYLNRIQFADQQAVTQAGVEVELVETSPMQESVSGNGEIVYDPSCTASVAARQPGTIAHILKNIGDHVERGEVLALVDAKAVGDAKSQLLRALAESKLQQQNVLRLKEASASIAHSRLLEAQAALSKASADLISAEQALANLGLPVDMEHLQRLNEKEVASALELLGIPTAVQSRFDLRMGSTNLLPITAAISGTVVQRNATLGQVIDPTQELFQVADNRRMWLMLSIPLESLDKVTVGQSVHFTPDASDRDVTGTVDWISPSADIHTRMIQVRTVLENTAGSLRNNTFGRGRIILRDTKDALVIPSQSVHWEGCCQIVFVRDRHYFDSEDSPKVFHVRSVRTGATRGDRTEIIAGLFPGEVIASAGSDVLRAQLLKNSLGAGCCVEE
ncbi:MAG: efflux RND transporter periplasmic adaptor subunit [Pirellulales bacterium]